MSDCNGAADLHHPQQCRRRCVFVLGHSLEKVPYVEEGEPGIALDDIDRLSSAVWYLLVAIPGSVAVCLCVNA